MPFNFGQTFQSPKLNEWQRQGIGMGLSTIPVVGPPAALAYNLARGINRFAQWYQGRGTGYNPGADTLNQLQGNPTDTADTGYNAPPGDAATPGDVPTPPPQGSGPNAGLGPTVNGNWRQVYDTGRFTGVPAFSPTVAQSQFPGSQIGPTSGMIGNPFNRLAFTHPGSGSGLSSQTQAWWNDIQSRNQK